MAISFPSLFKSEVESVKLVSLSRWFLTFVSILIKDFSSETSGVVIYVPHIGTCNLSTVINLTFRYIPLPVYQRLSA